MLKYQKIASLLEQRIRYGDYLLKEIPSERELASEINVSYMTARRAVLELVEKGLLVRQANKRLAVNREAGERKQVQIALLVPSLPSPYISQWHLWLEEMGAERNFFVRMIGYCHEHDAVIKDTIEGFDGVFFMPHTGEVPKSLIEIIKRSGTPVVSLGFDLSEYGIPSLRLTSPEMVQGLMGHLGSLGHRQIDCLNTTPSNQVAKHRIDQWQLWLAAHGGEGRLFDEPVEPYASAVQKAYQTMTRILTSGEPHSKVFFCTTSGSAIAAVRAVHDQGLRVGVDILICSADDSAGLAPLLVPSLTCLSDRTGKPYLSVCVDWILRGGKEWVGPLMVQPGDPSVFIGETTCPKKENGNVQHSTSNVQRSTLNGRK